MFRYARGGLMRDWRYNQRIASGSRLVRRPERRDPWWAGLSWDRVLAYGVTAVASLALLWLLAQVAIEVVGVLLVIALTCGALLFWRYRRKSQRAPPR